MTTTEEQKPVRSTIPARIDRLPWSAFHTRMVSALGCAWILDGLEINIVNSVSATLTGPDGLDLSVGAVSALATVYLIGQVVGALFFGQLSDRLGRRKLFMVTLAVYLLGSGLTAFTLGTGVFWLIFVYLTRFVAGLGIGGEYTAINSAIDELIPAPYRGRVDIGVNGTYWAGAVLGSVAELLVLTNIHGPWGWRIGFLIGPVLGLSILVVRRNLPESPRWQIMHGRADEAEASIRYIEQEVRASGRELPAVDESKSILLKPERSAGYLATAKVLFKQYPRRSVLGGSLMITQAFLYNAIYFTIGSVLSVFFGVDAKYVPVYLIPFSIGNLIGPLALAPLFDTIGRKKMIAGSYIISGVLLVVSALLFHAGVFDALGQVAVFCVIFFFASAGASSAYLTVSEIFPLEVRAKAIAIFFSIAQIFGAVAPLAYGLLIDKDHPDPTNLTIGYIGGALIMILGGVVAATMGISAEGRSLEDVAPPLSTVPAQAGNN